MGQHPQALLHIYIYINIYNVFCIHHLDQNLQMQVSEGHHSRYVLQTAGRGRIASSPESQRLKDDFVVGLGPTPKHERFVVDPFFQVPPQQGNSKPPGPQTTNLAFAESNVKHTIKTHLMTCPLWIQVAARNAPRVQNWGVKYLLRRYLDP